MAMDTGQVTVTTSPTLIVAARSRNYVGLVQGSQNDVWIGGPAVSPSTGVLLTGSKGTPFNWTGSDALYGVTGTGTSTVSYTESY